MKRIQNYEELIAPELCWPLMKLSIDCCMDSNSKQWICKVLKRKNGKRVGPLIIMAIFGSILTGLAATFGITAAVASG